MIKPRLQRELTGVFEFLEGQKEKDKFVKTAWIWKRSFLW
jgi:hypothetical protein